MANHSRKVVWLSRSLEMPLTPKTRRYFERRSYGPGEHGRARRHSESDYAVRLKEKQHLCAQYAIREAQLVKSFQEALRMEGRTGDNLITLLEQCLDVLVLRTDFGRTMFQACQIVTHRHVLMDSKIADHPSYRVHPGQTIQIELSLQVKGPLVITARGSHRDMFPAMLDYLNVDLERLHFTLNRISERGEVSVQCDIQLMIEYYLRQIRCL